MTAQQRRRECPRCVGLRVDLHRERVIHEAEVKVLAIMEALPQEKRGPVLHAAAALLGLDVCCPARE